jgi:acyl-CoA hydrolase
MADKPVPAKKKPSESDSVVSELMMPNQVNNLGHVFGGEVLSMVDRAGAVAAMRHAGSAAVTVSIDRMEVGVRVEAENLRTGVKRHTNMCFLTFVAIDDKHRPCRVPELDLSDPEDERRFREGRRRREVREALDRELEAKPL